jgi:tetratricopeptide (TPR) repeat protein
LSEGTEKAIKLLLLVALIFAGSFAIISRWALPPSFQEASKKPSLSKEEEEKRAKFRSLVDAGVKAAKDGRYVDALESFRQAEQSTSLMTAEQYASVKNARLQVASSLEAAGNGPQAGDVYKELAASALKQGQSLHTANRCDAAIEPLSDAVSFSQHLLEGKQTSLSQARGPLVSCLEEVHRFPEAVEVTQRVIADLQALGDPLADTLLGQYEILANEYAGEKDWEHAEQAIRFDMDLSDKIIAQFGPDPATDSVSRVGSAISAKMVAYRWLITAYNNQGKTDLALSTAEECFNYKLSLAEVGA